MLVFSQSVTSCSETKKLWFVPSSLRPRVASTNKSKHVRNEYLSHQTQISIAMWKQISITSNSGVYCDTETNIYHIKLRLLNCSHTSEYMSCAGLCKIEKLVGNWLCMKWCYGQKASVLHYQTPELASKATKQSHDEMYAWHESLSTFSQLMRCLPGVNHLASFHNYEMFVWRENLRMFLKVGNVCQVWIIENVWTAIWCLHGMNHWACSQNYKKRRAENKTYK